MPVRIQKFAAVKPVGPTPVGEDSLIGGDELQPVIIGMSPGPGYLPVSGGNGTTDRFSQSRAGQRFVEHDFFQIRTAHMEKQKSAEGDYGEYLLIHVTKFIASCLEEEQKECQSFT